MPISLPCRRIASAKAAASGSSGRSEKFQSACGGFPPAVPVMRGVTASLALPVGVVSSDDDGTVVPFILAGAAAGSLSSLLPPIAEGLCVKLFPGFSGIDRRRIHKLTCIDLGVFRRLDA